MKTVLSNEDIKEELRILEARFGMTSAEFRDAWDKGEINCSGPREYFRWRGLCHMAERNGLL